MYITLHYITLHYILHYYNHYITLHYITLHYITLHYITLHYITLQYLTVHYITLHYITLHYITLHYSSQLVIHSSNYPNAFLNNHVLGPVLKTLNDIHSFREFGRLFQSVGPETAKLRGPERTDEHLGMP